MSKWTLSLTANVVDTSTPHRPHQLFNASIIVCCRFQGLTLMPYLINGMSTSAIHDKELHFQDIFRTELIEIILCNQVQHPYNR